MNKNIIISHTFSDFFSPDFKKALGLTDGLY